ncbi:MAG: thiamine phosphate synthase [SAR324 cluster bacterium]
MTLPFRFYLITGRLQGRHEPGAWLPRLAQAGLRAVQVREKDLAPGALFALAARWRDAVQAQAPAAGLQFFLNDRADLALSLGFAGVHLREDSLPLARHAPLLRERLRFGVSCHSVEGVLAAEQAGATFATFGPVYETASKAAYGAPVGARLLEQAARALHISGSRLPLLALGGVTPERVKACREAGAWGVAAISAVWDAEDPVAALGRFAEELGGL